MVCTLSTSAISDPAAYDSKELAELESNLGLEVRTIDLEFVILSLCRSASIRDDWGPSHARWPKVCKTVHRQFEQEMKPLLAKRKEQILRDWHVELQETLSASEINTLLNFYRSVEGRRFIAFQNALYDVFLKSLRSIARQAAAGEENAGSSKADNSSDHESERQETLGLSLKSSLSRSHTTDVILMLMPAVINIAMTDQGPALDEIANLYATDLPQFKDFCGSEAVKKIVAAAAKLSQGEGSAKIQQAIASFWERHAKEWQTLYAKG